MSDGLISANQLKNHILGDIGEMIKIGIPITRDYLWKLINHAIEDAPIVDAVEVVRCKDCKYYKPMQELDGYGNVTFTYNNGACTRGRECHREWEPVTDEDYCSKGERREDDENAE
jgi:hypothetical protein